MELDLGEWPQAQAFLLGRYDPSSVGYLLRHLSSDGVMIDGGAHVGLITFQVAAKRSGCQIHAFEPHPRAVASFRSNLERSVREHDHTLTANVTLNECGLASEEGLVTFDFARYSSQNLTTNRGTIPVTTIDGYLAERAIDRVDVLKLDVEGSEFAALQGARRALYDHRIGAIVLETIEAHGSLHPAHQLLTDARYRPVPLPDLRPLVIRRLRPFTHRDNTAYEPVPA